MTDPLAIALAQIERQKERIAVLEAEAQAVERLLVHQERLLAALRVEVEESRALSQPK